MLEVHTVLCVLSCFFLSSVSGQSNTSCQGTGLDWYTDYVGETPCQSLVDFYYILSEHLSRCLIGQTYERLRQICTPDCAFYVSEPSLTADIFPRICVAF